MPRLVAHQISLGGPSSRLERAVGRAPFYESFAPAAKQIIKTIHAIPTLWAPVRSLDEIDVFTLSQKMGTFLRCMDAALRFFGGRTQVDGFDNMSTVVKERAGQTPVVNPRFLAYAAARGFGVRACTPARPTEKPYVERPIGFVRTRFWPHQLRLMCENCSLPVVRHHASTAFTANTGVSWSTPTDTSALFAVTSYTP